MKEVNSLISDQVSCQILGGIHETDDERASEICASEKLGVAGLPDRLLVLDDTTDHSDSFGDFDSGTLSETPDRYRRLLEFTLSDEPVWRFGREEHENRKWCGEHPLKSDRNPKND